MNYFFRIWVPKTGANLSGAAVPIVKILRLWHDGVSCTNIRPGHEFKMEVS
jgi:hypothetical protein